MWQEKYYSVSNALMIKDISNAETRNYDMFKMSHFFVHK